MKVQSYSRALMESLKTKLIHAGDLKEGMVMIRQGNDGDIEETILSAEKRKFHIYYRVRDNKTGKEYDMNDRATTFVRVYA